MRMPVFNNVCDVNETVRISSGNEQFRCRCPSNSDVVAFGGIQRTLQIYQPYGRPLCGCGETILTSSAKSGVVTSMTLGRLLSNNKN